MSFALAVSVSPESSPARCIHLDAVLEVMLKAALPQRLNYIAGQYGTFPINSFRMAQVDFIKRNKVTSSTKNHLGEQIVV